MVPSLSNRRNSRVLLQPMEAAGIWRATALSINEPPDGCKATIPGTQLVVVHKLLVVQTCLRPRCEPNCVSEPRSSRASSASAKRCTRISILTTWPLVLISARLRCLERRILAERYVGQLSLSGSYPCTSMLVSAPRPYENDFLEPLWFLTLAWLSIECT